jgi:AraC-like DNA-binding protein
MILNHPDKILEKDELVKFKTLSHFTTDFGTEPRRLTEEKFTYLLIFIKQGNGVCLIDTDTVTLKPGTLLFINPFSFLQLVDTQFVQGTVIICTEEFICRTHLEEQLLYKTSYGPNMRTFFQLEGNEVALSYLQSQITMFGWEYRFGKDVFLKLDILHNIVQGILLYLHKLQLEKEQVKMDLVEPLAKSQVVQFIQLLNSHFKTESSLQFYADQMNVTMKQLVLICKKGVGWSPKAIMQEKLLREAKRLLLFDIMSIKEVCYELGFTEPTNFVKFFQQHTGFSPKNYKLNNCVTGLDPKDEEEDDSFS